MTFWLKISDDIRINEYRSPKCGFMYIHQTPTLTNILVIAELINDGRYGEEFAHLLGRATTTDPLDGANGLSRRRSPFGQTPSRFVGRSVNTWPAPVPYPAALSPSLRAMMRMHLPSPRRKIAHHRLRRKICPSVGQLLLFRGVRVRVMRKFDLASAISPMVSPPLIPR